MRKLVLWAALTALLTILVAAPALALLGGPNLDALMLDDPRHAAERWLEARVPAGATVEIAGNPRFQARPPRGRVTLYTSPDSLRVSPRGPRGDVVLLSSLDAWFFTADSLTRAVWWDSLVAAPPAGRYVGPLVFRPTTNARFAAGLFVSPTVRIFQRAATDAAPAPASRER